MSSPARNLVSEEEFLQMPETQDKIELIDGEVIVAPCPTFRHQEILIRLVSALDRWARTQPNITLGLSPLDVRFAAGRILQPDAFILMGKIAADHKGPIDAIPQICIEVLSTDRAYDRVMKRYLYAEAGVRELWIVEQSGLVERWSGDGLQESEEITDTLQSALLPGFELQLRELSS